MFWKGRVSLTTNCIEYLRSSDLKLLDLKSPTLPSGELVGGCRISVSTLEDGPGIARLLNEYFEESSSKVRAYITPEIIQKTKSKKEAIWMVAKDRMGTIRGCVASIGTGAPYPNNLPNHIWGLIDWFCIHPLWRSKGIGSALLEALDFITYRLGRKAHIFLKEGIPLPLPHVPIYFTWLKRRRAGSKNIKALLHTELHVESYNTVEKDTGLPLLKVDGPSSESAVADWEEMLDTEFPECWVFVDNQTPIDYEKGWITDSLVSMYAFRWTPGKYLGSKPSVF
jgi:GNAT superfamily N-acetyltransferase